MVARVWVPAVSCPNCSYPNDASFAFCQQCGYTRRKETSVPDSEKVFLDLAAIDDRLEALRKVKSGKPYQKVQPSARTRAFSSLFSLSQVSYVSPPAGFNEVSNLEG